MADSRSDLLARMRDISFRRNALLGRLVGPARAAANQMMDAGMKAGTDPLQTVLFELDALEGEVKSLFDESGPEAIADALIEGMGPR